MIHLIVFASFNVMCLCIINIIIIIIWLQVSIMKNKKFTITNYVCGFNFQQQQQKICIKNTQKHTYTHFYTKI